MNHPQRIDRISRVILGTRTSSSYVNGRSLQPITRPSPYSHYQPMLQPAQPANSYPKKIEYIYVYAVEMNREVQSIAAEMQAIKTGLRMRNAELQRNMAQMKLQIEQMRLSKT